MIIPGERSPCMACTSREIGCHADCEIFGTWKRERVERDQDIWQTIGREQMLDGVQAAARRRMALRKGRRRRS